MFGSRLRSWMETHIVRPRKRNNKNKQGNGNTETTKKDTVHLHTNGFSTTTSTTLNSNGSANHCCGNGVVASPVRRREVSPIQNHSRYGWQSPDSEIITSPKSDNFLYAPKHHRFGHEPNYRHKFDQKTGQPTSLSEPKNTIPTHTQPQLNPENSSSSFSSLSWSTGSKEQSVVSIERQNLAIERSKQLQVPIITYQTTNEENHLDEEADAVHYEEIQTTILRHPDNIANRNFIFQERPKSEQLTTFTPLHKQADYPERRSIDDSSSARYGKLLPSRIQWKCRGSSESLGAASNECLPWHKPLNTGVHSSQHHRLRNGYAPSATKTNNLKGNGIPLHSLSSPESAYSTGYSTDGTSPGACYNQAPEYYINMRTGTHYFPKTVNSLAIETQRCKFGLNKIEEMSPIEPQPKTSFAAACNKTSKSNIYACPGSPYKSIQNLDTRNVPVLPTFHGYESSSPRQRCRIRTNPWVSTQTMVPTGVSFQQTSNTSTTSSTIRSTRSSTLASTQKDLCSFNNGGGHQYLKDNKRKHSVGCSDNGTVDIYKQNSKAVYDSSSSLDTEDTKQCTVSLTEVGLSGYPRASTPNTLMLEKCLGKRELSAVVMTTYPAVMQPVACLDASEEDATLNEMMGKFDESYVYEKETDILSDSDATNCLSELDTGDAGDDAGDECDTDELLDIDFIDTISIQEISQKQENRSIQDKCPVYQPFSEGLPPFGRHSFRSTRGAQDVSSENKASGSSGRRRKRLIKTRKKSTNEQKENVISISPLRRSRETRSAGGTPISLRRNAKAFKERNHKTVSLSERASSLVFPPDRGQQYRTVAEGNNALLKADLEADFKYRQLIQEAESILVSLKSSAQSLPRETPISSPRRLNPLINKRVEMLKINEIKQPISQPPRSADMEQDFSAVLNKRIELLKHESTSAPNSPRSIPRCSPSKTHITNFINQIDGSRKTTLITNEHQLTTYSPQCQNRSPLKASPLRRRHPAKDDDTKHTYHFDSESETDHSAAKFLTTSSNFNYEMDVENHNCLPEIARNLLRKNTYEDYTNHNLDVFETNINSIEATNIGKHYCPQSEPLKRKVYKGSKNFDRIKCNFVFESERAEIQHTQENSWKTRRHTANVTPMSLTPKSSTQDLNLNSPLLVNRKQLLLDTLSELKQNLENQSVELNELNID